MVGNWLIDSRELRLAMAKSLFFLGRHGGVCCVGREHGIAWIESNKHGSEITANESPKLPLRHVHDAVTVGSSTFASDVKLCVRTMSFPYGVS